MRCAELGSEMRIRDAELGCGMRSSDPGCGARIRDAELGPEVPEPGSEVPQLGRGARTQGSATWIRGLGALVLGSRAWIRPAGNWTPTSGLWTLDPGSDRRPGWPWRIARSVNKFVRDVLCYANTIAHEVFVWELCCSLENVLAHRFFGV